jgi:hypothetical protein
VYHSLAKSAKIIKIFDYQATLHLVFSQLTTQPIRASAAKEAGNHAGKAGSRNSTQL